MLEVVVAKSGEEISPVHDLSQDDVLPDLGRFFLRPQLELPAQVVQDGQGLSDFVLSCGTFIIAH